MSLIQPAVLLLHALANKKVILRLLDNGANETQSISDAPGIGDLTGRPLRCTPVESLAVVDEVVESTNDLLHGGVAVWTMRVDNIHIGQIQSLQRQVHALDDVLSGQTVVIEGLIGVGGVCPAPVDLGMLVSCRTLRQRSGINQRLERTWRVPYLGGNDQVILLPTKLLNGLS
jgi:hypothetical protein